MATTLFFLQLLIVLAMIFIGAKVGGIGLGIYGMVGVFILVFGFGLEPGVIPIDVMQASLLRQQHYRQQADWTIWSMWQYAS